MNSCQKLVATPHRRREGAPKSERGGDHPAAAVAVGEVARTVSQDRIEEREGRAAQQPELGVSQMEFGDDRARKNAENLAVEKLKM